MDLTSLEIGFPLVIGGLKYRVSGHVVDVPDVALSKPSSYNVLHYYCLLPEDEGNPPVIVEVWPSNQDRVVVWRKVGETSGETQVFVDGVEWLADGEPLATEYLLLQGQADYMICPYETWLKTESDDRDLWIIGGGSKFTLWLPEEIVLELA